MTVPPTARPAVDVEHRVVLRELEDAALDVGRTTRPLRRLRTEPQRWSISTRE
jgi:hypothetical protein